MPELIYSKLAEVIETSSTGFTAQCYDLNAAPALGSLVKTSLDGMTVYAVVAYVSTTSLEPGRKPVARGKDIETEEAIFQANPQLEKLLRCEVAAIIVGHQLDGEVKHYLPPRPARLHGFVHACDDAEVRAFSQKTGFISLLLAAQTDVSAEEMTAAVIRRMSASYEGDGRRQFLVTAGKALAQLLSADYNRLKSILERLAA
ncbi:hypothetical protein [Dehalogenimonas alkenigignens]|uniref:Uncharacterized protein n=1 Tax=Dehalogenimonas alkenigignens TaxID=1217799 RepID=A0A0W0GGC4_9CHLR|nr:hypothetical protein [Dehalogenimonas alkenigignens]KTB47616.1 hypothetical protein DEALK_04610 [Dehalogenimonas alkenigignens]PVV82844.1 hypothetical protein DD509_07565 [Dehalogenimonas alkenigignens]